MSVLNFALPAICLLSLLPATARAEQGSEIRDVNHRVVSFFEELSSGDFQRAFARMSTGARGYLAEGSLKEITTDEIRDRVIENYHQAHAIGMRLSLAPADVKTSVHQNMAITTLVVRGTIQSSTATSPKQHERRTTLVWTKVGSEWKILHWHTSEYVEEPELEG